MTLQLLLETMLLEFAVVAGVLRFLAGQGCIRDQLRNLLLNAQIVPQASLLCPMVATTRPL